MADNSQFVSMNVPATVQPGQQFQGQVTLENTGTTVWSQGGANPYNLGSETPRDNTRWGMSRVPLPVASVNPGEQVTFDTTFTAPAIEGTFAFAWRMLKENVAWFGSLPTQNILVQGDPIPIPPPPPTGQLPVPRTDANDLVSGIVANTGAFDMGQHTYPDGIGIAEWTNESGHTLAIRKARVWTGVQTGIVCDVHAQLEREDGTILCVNAWDHYQDPTLPLHGISEDFTPYVALATGEKLFLKYWNDPFGVIGKKTHHVAYVWATYLD